MSDKVNVSERDKALLGILERIAGELGEQDILLENIYKSQKEHSKAIQTTNNRIDSHRMSTEKAIDRIHDSISRYRSDMLSIVNEQDHISSNFKELGKLINQTTFAIENTNKRIAVLEERIKPLESAISKNHEHSTKHADTTVSLFTDVEHNAIKLHADTEKRISDLHGETEQQIERLHQDTSRRFLALVGIEAALNTLLIRTEPPEKKKSRIIKLFRRISGFFKYWLPSKLRRKYR
ncbi:MAG: hypothetical protein LBD23_11600 [Oscillospiraceae bacterium]|jgi:chromosome segregation ATPase|nr:hypothetical protein [Oscillospiraceae bacterium]